MIILLKATKIKYGVTITGTDSDGNYFLSQHSANEFYIYKKDTDGNLKKTNYADGGISSDKKFIFTAPEMYFKGDILPRILASGTDFNEVTEKGVYVGDELLGDMLIKGTVFYLILLYSSLSDNHTRTLNDAASVMVVITSFIGTDVSDIPKMVLSALVLFGVLLIFAVATNGGLGGADIKLTGACALVLGLWSATFGLIVGLCLAIAHTLIKYRGKDKNDDLAFPFVPYLSIGYMAGFFLQGGF